MPLPHPLPQSRLASSGAMPPRSSHISGDMQLPHVKKRHLAFVGLFFFGLVTFWSTHRSVSSISEQEAAAASSPGKNLKGSFSRWVADVVETPTVREDTSPPSGRTAEIDFQLRAAMESLSPEKLARAVAAARKVNHSTPPMKAAIFMLEHLTDGGAASGEATQGVDAKQAAPQPSLGEAVTKLASAATVDVTKTTDLQGLPFPPPLTKLDPQLGVYPPDPPRVKAPPALQRPPAQGKPQKWKWWSNPPSELAGVLPENEQAARFDWVGDSLTDNTNAEQRHKGILALAEERFLPSKFPIGVVAYNRPELLELSLQSLLNVRGITRSQITVYQDGEDSNVQKVAESMGIALKQHHGNANPLGAEGAAQIARHYRWTFSSLFDDHPAAEYAIVVEDDMLFASDFLTFFTQLAPLYEKDPSILCITSWNDNGQSGLSVDPRVLLRTDFFVGLGWMISKKIYKGELEKNWPQTHWDHWLRDPQQRKGRQTIYPEVPRNFNIGKRGTHSDEAMYARYFQRIVLNKQPAVWLGDVQRMISYQYEVDLHDRLASAVQVRDTSDLDGAYAYTDLVLFLALSSKDDARWEKHYAPYFGLWHSMPFIRGMYQEGVVLTRWKTNHLLLVFSHAHQFMKHRKSATPVLDQNAFRISLDRLTIVRGVPGYDSCNAVCARQAVEAKGENTGVQMVCSPSGLMRINECEVIEKYFHCKSCEVNYGADQPAYVHKAELGNAGFCLINSRDPECDGGHPDTTRLCACIKADS